MDYYTKKKNPYDLAMKLNKIIKHYKKLQLKIKYKKKILTKFTNDCSNQNTLRVINKI